MSIETLEILGGIFSADIPVIVNFDADHLRRESKLNIAANLRSAVTPQKHPQIRGNERSETMAKKEKIDKTDKPVAVERCGKFKFIKENITSGTMTFDEIVAAAKKQFPGWTESLVKCGVFSARTQMRKAGSAANWVACAAKDASVESPAIKA